MGSCDSKCMALRPLAALFSFIIPGNYLYLLIYRNNKGLTSRRQAILLLTVNIDI